MWQETRNLDLKTLRKPGTLQTTRSVTRTHTHSATDRERGHLHPIDVTVGPVSGGPHAHASCGDVEVDSSNGRVNEALPLLLFRKGAERTCGGCFPLAVELDAARAASTRQEADREADSHRRRRGGGGGGRGSSSSGSSGSSSMATPGPEPLVAQPATSPPPGHNVGNGGPALPNSRGLERALEEATFSGALNLSARKLKEFPRTAAGLDLSDTVDAGKRAGVGAGGAGGGGCCQ